MKKAMILTLFGKQSWRDMPATKLPAVRAVPGLEHGNTAGRHDTGPKTPFASTEDIHAHNLRILITVATFNEWHEPSRYEGRVSYLELDFLGLARTVVHSLYFMLVSDTGGPYEGSPLTSEMQFSMIDRQCCSSAAQ